MSGACWWMMLAGAVEEAEWPIPATIEMATRNDSSNL